MIVSVFSTILLVIIIGLGNFVRITYKISLSKKKHKILLFYLITLLVLVWIFSILWTDLRPSKESDLYDIFVEAHGMIFDLLVFSIIYHIYESFVDFREEIDKEKLERETKIDGYKSELQTMVRIDSPDMAVRIGRILGELNKLNVTDIDLSACRIKGVALRPLDLRGAILFDTDFSDVLMFAAKFQSARFAFTNFKGATIIGSEFQNTKVLANFKDADVSCSNFFNCEVSCNFTGADLRKCNFQFAKLKNSILDAKTFHNANLKYSNLEGALVTDPHWIENLKKEEVEGYHNIEELYFVNTKINIMINSKAYHPIESK